MTLQAGRPHPLGATPGDGGTNFAVFSAHATRVTLCLFDGARERRIDLPERTGDIWHGHVAGVGAGQRYGLRAHGPWAPAAGHLFNPHKLLLDPYARRIEGEIAWSDALHGANNEDSAPFMPRGVVTDHAPAPASHPRTPWERTVIYEAHVKSLTALHPDVARPGTFEALASDPVLDHLQALGVTAIELLPVHGFVDDRFLVEKGLRNHWGYQTIGFFAPQGRYLAGDDALAVRRAVDRFHARGIEVLLDVVYNHSGEGDATGPHLSFRGLDNASYYRLDARGAAINVTGTGNTFDLSHPAVLRMVLDSLRYWVEVMGVDGFRFDLAPVLGRVGAHEGRFDAAAPFFHAIAQDPVLAGVKLIAEPWDIGPGGYNLGGFPRPFAEWNDKFRDGVRRFWRGDVGARYLARRVTGSARQFDHSGRRPTDSVNFVTAHDGFTLRDLASYERRHNHANGEDNRDGHGENISQNFGVEGETDDPAILAARARRRRNLLATLLLSQGTPMLLAGDEIGHSQGGNNNAYAQDNETTWLDWRRADRDFLAFVRRLVRLRHAHPVLSQARFLHSRTRADDVPDLFWWREDGAPMGAEDWHDAERRLLAVEMRTAAGTPPYAAREDALFLVFNAGGARDVTLPDATGAKGTKGEWRRALDTARPDLADEAAGGRAHVEAESVSLFVLA